jgi:ABC-2 type transport system permease protein
MSTPSRSRFAGAGYWAGFHFVRNLRRRGTLVWVIGVPLVVAAMRLGFGVPADAVGELVLVYLVPLMSLAFGGGVLREEVEDQTLTYGFTRPVDRAGLYAARLFAAAGPVLLATVPAAAMAASDAVHGLRLVVAAILGTAAHAALFGLWGLVMRRPTWLGLAYVLVWEQSLQNVPGWLANVTLRAHIRNLGRLDAPGLAIFGSADPGPWWGSALVLATVASACVVVAGMIVRRRELVLSR